MIKINFSYNKKLVIVNSITLSRLLIILPIFFVSNVSFLIVATVWVSFSDFLDGYLARKWRVVTSFGAILDQYSDKITTFFLLFFFINRHKISLLFGIIILVREILILFLRKKNWAVSQSNVIGKLKTALLYILFILLSIDFIIVTFTFNLKLIVMSMVIATSLLSLLLSIPLFTNKLLFFIGTTGFSSIIMNKAPGTISSFIIFLLLFVGLNELAFEYKLAILSVLLLMHFSYFKNFVGQTNSADQDPGIYTLDETIAIVVAWIFMNKLHVLHVFILFILFRFFDIFKPFGIKLVETQINCNIAVTNLADDIIAMIYSLIIFQILIMYVL